MAQGNSIGNLISGAVEGAVCISIRPPIGETWLITWMSKVGTTDVMVHFYNVSDNISELVPNALLDNPNIRIFIDTSYWIIVCLTSASYNAEFAWSGVVFKG